MHLLSGSFVFYIGIIVELQDIDKAVYKEKQRKVAIVLCIIFAVLGMSLSTLSRHWFGTPQGDNMWVNLAGVFAGLFITIFLFSRVSGREYYDELRYGWNLKKQALKIQNHRHRWEELLEEGNATAAIVLAFYYKATLQLQFLDGNEFGHSDTLERENKFLQRCNELNLEPNADQYSIDMLLTMK